MNTDTCSFADDTCHRLQADGYCVHHGADSDGPDLVGQYWFSRSKPEMPTRRSAAPATPSGTRGRTHWRTSLPTARSRSLSAEPSAREIGPFFAARLNERALDVDTVAQRFGVARELAVREVEKLRRQSVHLSDQFQVCAIDHGTVRF